MQCIGISILRSILDGRWLPSSLTLSLLLPDSRIVQFRKPTQPKILILGDSMAHRLRRILHATIIARPGASVQGLQYFLTAQSAPKLDEFGIVVLWIGTNNRRAPWDETKAAYINLFNTLKLAVPSAKVALVSILPRPRDYASSRAWVAAANTWLRSACRRHNFFFLAANHLVMKQGQIRESLFKDGLHLNHDGARRFGDFLRTKIHALFP
jgi:hypothetical protein